MEYIVLCKDLFKKCTTQRLAWVATSTESICSSWSFWSPDGKGPEIDWKVSCKEDMYKERETWWSATPDQSTSGLCSRFTWRTSDSSFENTLLEYVWNMLMRGPKVCLLANRFNKPDDDDDEVLLPNDLECLGLLLAVPPPDCGAWAVNGLFWSLGRRGSTTIPPSHPEKSLVPPSSHSRQRTASLWVEGARDQTQVSKIASEWA